MVMNNNIPGTRFGWLKTGVVAAVIAAVAVWEFQAVARLRATQDREGAELQQLRAERDRRAREQRAAIQAAAAARAEAEAHALQEARDKIGALRQAVAGAEKARAETDRFAVGSRMLASEWRNAGFDSAKAALETVLWAGAGGDVATLAHGIHFWDAKTRAAAQALLDSAPADLRAQYPTPAEFLAYLTVKDMPLASAQIKQVNELSGWPMPATQLDVMLASTDGQPKQTNLLLGNPDGKGWKLVAMPGVIAKYAAQLHPPPAEKK